MKSSTFSVLRLLADGDFHSGEEMARQLGVSRASVWQALRNLGDSGVEVFRVPGRGYRLREPLQWLDKSAILSALGGKASLFDLDVLEKAESTNTLLLRKAAEGAPHGACVVAEMQTAGRGRRGREWHASLGGSLTFSLLWRFDQGAGYLSGLSLAVGVGLMRALQEVGVSGAALKWPNDILFQYRKLAGILIELQGDMLGPSAAVIGVGLNLRLPESVLNRIDQAAVDIQSIVGQVPERNRLLAHLLSHLAEVLVEFETAGFGGLREEWIRYHAYHGKPVRLTLPDGSRHEGDLLDIGEDGALLVLTPEGKRRYASGEVSLRGAAS